MRLLALPLALLPPKGVNEWGEDENENGVDALYVLRGYAAHQVVANDHPPVHAVVTVKGQGVPLLLENGPKAHRHETDPNQGSNSRQILRSVPPAMTPHLPETTTERGFLGLFQGNV